jgi:hypothetical protein
MQKQWAEWKWGWIWWHSKCDRENYGNTCTTLFLGCVTHGQGLLIRAAAISRNYTNPMKQSPFDKLIVSQPVKKFPVFYAARRFITVFTKACNSEVLCNISWQGVLQWRVVSPSPNPSDQHAKLISKPHTRYHFEMLCWHHLRNYFL